MAVFGLYSYTAALDENDAVRVKIMPFSDACIVRPFFAVVEESDSATDKEMWNEINNVAKNNLDAFCREMEEKFGVTLKERKAITLK